MSEEIDIQRGYIKVKVRNLVNSGGRSGGRIENISAKNNSAPVTLNSVLYVVIEYKLLGRFSHLRGTNFL